MRLLNLSFAVLFFISSESLAQIKTIVAGENTTCVYNLNKGRITGNYISFYENGKKKSEGLLLNGYRKGKWTVWDSTGRIRMVRIYQNPFEYDRIFPAVSNEGPIPLLIQNQYKLEYDSNKVIRYAYIDVMDAIWRNKYWRYLEPAENDILFKTNRFIKLILNLAQNKQIEIYETTDDRFTTVLNKDSARKIINQDTLQFAAIELKEENIFDMNRLLSEYRIVGLCPIIKVNNKLQKLFWIYYPDLRKYLGREIITDSSIAYVKTFDDLFIFRDFSSVITKTTNNNPSDLPISKYPRMTDAEKKQLQEIEEINIIEAENNIWINLTK